MRQKEKSKQKRNKPDRVRFAPIFEKNSDKEKGQVKTAPRSPANTQ